MKLIKSDFQIETLDDELRVDTLCRELLITFYNERIASGLSEHDSTLLANSADYYLRDYLIGARQQNLLDSDPAVVKKFAGNWYIVNTMEPVIEEIDAHLKGVREFYLFLLSINAIDEQFYRLIEKDCLDSGYYKSRIESFWDIKGDEYFQWERECSLK